MNENTKNLEKIQYNKHNYKMSLLFIQTKELKRFYNSKMENNLKAYNLVDKEWLDNYKEKNDYNSADMFDTFNDWKNYEDFREVMGDSFLVDDSFFTRINNSVPCKKIKFKYGIKYPNNVELVCKQYVIDCLKDSVTFPMYDILIGDKSIIIIDEESKMKNKGVIFICSLMGKEEDYNFAIKVDYIIIYNNLKIMNEELKEISLSNGINNYFLKRKIDINNSEEQNIINSKNENIGKFLISTKEEGILKSTNYEIKNPIYKLLNNQNIQNNFNNDNNNNNNKIINNNNNFFQNNYNQINNNNQNIINNNQNYNKFSGINKGNNPFINNNLNNYNNNQNMIYSTPNLNTKNFNININNQNESQNNFYINNYNQNNNINNINRMMFYNMNNNNSNQYNNNNININQISNNNNNINCFTNFNNFNNNNMFYNNNNNFNYNNMANNINYNPNNFQINNNMNNNMNFDLNNNNLNFNLNNNLINQNNNEGDDDDFNLHFKYKSKEVVLYIKPGMKFTEIQKELLDNYDFFKQINIKGFSFRNQMINPDYTCEQLNIKSDSKIFIIEN